MTPQQRTRRDASEQQDLLAWTLERVTPEQALQALMKSRVTDHKREVELRLEVMQGHLDRMRERGWIK